MRTVAWLSAAAIAVSVIGASGAARADLVYDGLQTISGAGFGTESTLITLGSNHSDESASLPTGATGPFSPSSYNQNFSGVVGTGASQYGTYSLSSLGWTTGSNVAIGINTNQAGNPKDPLTVNALSISVFDTTTNAIVDTFTFKGTPLTFSSADIAAQNGQGAALFVFTLNSLEQSDFNTLIAANTFAHLAVVANSFSVSGNSDGPDSVIAFNGMGVVPLPPAALLFGTALAGLGLLGRRRKLV